MGGRRIIPRAFGERFQDSRRPALYYLAGSQGRQDDQQISSAFIWLDGRLRIEKYG